MPDWLTSKERSQFRRGLLQWFDLQQRDLPWRNKKSRYRIWVSEIMLQQTQVVTVIDYFNRFMESFPNVRALAKADEAAVLKMWEGLGYYRRARQMHAAAKEIVEQHKGTFPKTFDGVLALPGIGRYTAGAILSIADDVPLPVLEGNTLRVYSRLMNFTDDVLAKNGQNALWGFAESLVTKSRPGDLNQALMELGSEVCRVKKPMCLVCPVRQHCVSLQQGDPLSLPNKGSKKIKYESLHQAAIVVQRNAKVLVRLCGPDEHWTGLWDFPRYTVDGSLSVDGTAVETAIFLAKQLQQKTGLSVSIDKPAFELKHAVTKYRIRLSCYQAEDVSGRLRSSAELKWVPFSQLGELAMSSTGRKIADRVII